MRISSVPTSTILDSPQAPFTHTVCTLYTDTLASRGGKPITPGGDSLIHVKPPQELIRNKFHRMMTCLHQLGRKLEKVTPYCGDGQILKCLTGMINPAEFHWEHAWTKGGYCANMWLPLSVCTCTRTQRRSRSRVHQREKKTEPCELEWWKQDAREFFTFAADTTIHHPRPHWIQLDYFWVKPEIIMQRGFAPQNPTAHFFSQTGISMRCSIYLSSAVNICLDLADARFNSERWWRLQLSPIGSVNCVTWLRSCGVVPLRW